MWHLGSNLKSGTSLGTFLQTSSHFCSGLKKGTWRVFETQNSSHFLSSLNIYKNKIRKVQNNRSWIHFYLPVFSNCLVFGNTDVFTLLLLDGTRNFTSFLNAFLVTFFLHLEIGDKGNNIMANILAGFLVSAKFNRFWLLTIGFGRATTDRWGIGRDGKSQNGKRKDFHFSAGF